MSPLRDLFIAPRPADVTPDWAGPLRRRRCTTVPAFAPSLGLLASARDLLAAAACVGLSLAQGGAAALVCLRLPGAAITAALPAPDVAAAPPAAAPPASLPAAPALPGPRAPARAGAARLAASLRARGLAAEARGRLALVALPEEPDGTANGAARAIAAAGSSPTVLAVAARGEDIDVLLAARDAILVVTPPSTDPALAALTLASAAELTPSAAAVRLALDPVARGLAVAGLRAPRAVRDAVAGVVG